MLKQLCKQNIFNTQDVRDIFEHVKPVKFLKSFLKISESPWKQQQSSGRVARSKFEIQSNLTTAVCSISIYYKVENKYLCIHEPLVFGL